ncbi:MAG: DUF349 domain-containing protein [Bacteroidetes bacterium]|nr:DUF349 domain-containing protein [Bacteroidota bacterium]MDA1224207.1 DUF349 domain-containing protein [Bacteroidota bacterium]
MSDELEKAAESYADQLTVAEQMIELNTEEISLELQYSTLSKEELLAAAEELVHATDVKKAYNQLQAIRNALDDLLDQERPGMIRTWVEAGNDPRDFVAPADNTKQSIQQIITAFKKRREHERKRAEEEKLHNLKQKQLILDKIKALVDSEENDQSLNALREYMRQWKEVRQIPKEYQDELYAAYKFQVDKFYNQLSVFNELKELDKEKNLELKIDLIKRGEQLKDEPNIRKALLQLNKYHDDWKNTGPVRAEISEDIWKRFKAASDIVIDAKKAEQATIDAERQQNLDKKIVLIERAETSIAVVPTQPKEWAKIGKELDELMSEWKKIGPVPTDKNEEIWNKFKAIRNQYYGERKHFFKDLNSSKKDNLTKKEALCDKAESLKDSNEFMKTSDALAKLQDEWKTVGPVPEDQNDLVWKRFRTAFDHFYARKNEWFKQRKQEESGAIVKKKEVILGLEALKSNEAIDHQTLFNELKVWQKQWNDAGFISGKSYQQMNKSYQALADEIFNRYRAASNNQRNSNQKEHFSNLATSTDGQKRLQWEERKIKEKITKFKDEIATMENNKSFFKHSKNAGAFVKQFDDNIAKATVQIAKAEQELKLLKSVKS